MSQMQYDPKLKRVIKRVEKILKQEGVAGIVVLHSPGFSEYLLKVDAPHSCAVFDKVNGALRANNKGLSASEKKRKATGTVNMFFHFRAVTKMLYENTSHMMKLFEKKFQITATGNGFSDNRSQNN